ncbi:MAG: hypothetical protein Q9204_004480, partial [Flavoplaca sp. TL-2023a]
IYDLFEDMITAHPALATSFVQFEAFPMQAVKAVDPASTAYAHRQDDILVFVSPIHSTPPPPLPFLQITTSNQQHLRLTNPPSLSPGPSQHNTITPQQTQPQPQNTVVKRGSFSSRALHRCD